MATAFAEKWTFARYKDDPDSFDKKHEWILWNFSEIDFSMRAFKRPEGDKDIEVYMNDSLQPTVVKYDPTVPGLVRNTKSRFNKW